MIWPTGPHFEGNAGARTASFPMYQDFERNARAFDFVFCRFETSSSITTDAGTERVNAELVSGNYFQAQGGFYHDGRFAALQAVVDHYDQLLGTGLSQEEKEDLIAYLNTL